MNDFGRRQSKQVRQRKDEVQLTEKRKTQKLKRLKDETVGKSDQKQREDLFATTNETNTMNLYLKKIMQSPRLQLPLQSNSVHFSPKPSVVEIFFGSIQQQQYE